jgi:hypothetical protein
MKSTDRTTRKTTPRKIKASPKGKTKDVKPGRSDAGWVKRMNAVTRQNVRADNRVFTVFAGAILKASLSMDQKVELLELVSKAIRDDRVRRLLEQELHKADQAYCEEPNNKNRALVEVVRLDLAGLDGPDGETVERYLGRPSTEDEIDRMERGVPLSTIVANIIAMQRLPSLSAQPAPTATTPPSAA